jgi:hypothetical protein
MNNVLVGLAMMQLTPCIPSLMFQNSYYSTENDLSEVMSFLHKKIVTGSWSSFFPPMAIGNVDDSPTFLPE